jgi:V8-like Glu-specific endopeptidase
VVSEDPRDRAIRPQRACVRFEAIDRNKSDAVDSIVWTSGRKKLDATILRLKDPVTDIAPLRPSTMPPTLDGNPRVYIIGYPGGGDLSISFQDNALLDHEAPPEGKPVDPAVCHLHYRAPTQKGSSGSPVFDPLLLEVVALHHAGGESMRRLNGKIDKWPANEGIWIQSILDGINDLARCRLPGA